MKHFLLASFVCLLSFTGMAQSKNVTGKVTDASGNGIPDVAVMLEGTTKGTATNNGGGYSLSVNNGDNTIVFSAIGFKTVKRKVDSKTTKLNVVLQEDITMLSEAIIRTERKLAVNKLNIKNLDAPMLTHTVSHKLLEQTNATNIEEASKHITGLKSITQYGGFQFFNIRGFENFVLLYDGIRDERHNIATSSTATNLANVERIEVLKGASGDMFGHSALGGIMNIIRKKPSYVLKGNANVTVGSYNTANVTLGIGGPISDKLRFRVDAGRNKTDGFRGLGSITRNASVMLDYTPTNKDKLSLLLQYSNDSYSVDPGIPGTPDGKAIGLFDPKLNYADPNDFLKDLRKELQLNYTHKFNDNIYLTNKFFITDDLINYLGDEVLFLDADGKHFSRLNYGGYHFDRIAKTLGNQFDVSFKFNTGNIKHKSVVGTSFNYLNRQRDYNSIGVIGDQYDLVKNISITNPTTNPLYKKTLKPSETLLQKELVSSIYAHDWITFSNRFKILLGVRYDYYDGFFIDKSPISNLKPKLRGKQGNFTYRGAISYQPVKNFLTVYASASSFFKPVRNHGHNRNGSLFRPETGYQGEVGLKMEVKNKLHLNLAGFYISKDNFTIGHSEVKQIKQATSKGFELDFDAQITKGLYAKFGYTYVDATFRKGKVPILDTEYNTVGWTILDGNKTQWTPEHQANLWLNYEFSNVLKGLGFGLGANYVGKTYQDPENFQTLPAYTVLDGTIYYQTKNNIRIGLNIENLTNKLYYTSALSSSDLWWSDANTFDSMAKLQMYPGRDRNFKLSISYEF